MWFKKHLNMTFKPYGCAEFVEKVLRSEFNLFYDFPKTTGDLRKDPDLIKNVCESKLFKTAMPQDGDIVLMGGDRESCHVGIFCRHKGRDYVLHTDRKMRVSSLTQLDNLIFLGYFLEGFYTWRR